MWGQEVYGNSGPSSQFCCEPIKNSPFKRKTKGKKNTTPTLSNKEYLMEYSQKYLPSLIMRSKQESEYSGLKTSQLLDITSNPSYIPYPPKISTPKINHILAFDSANAPHETSDPPIPPT